MFKIFFILLSLHFLLFGDDFSKGKNIFKILCNQKAVNAILYDNKEELKYQIKDRNYCSNADDKKLNLIVYYITNREKNRKKITIPSKAKCPVCGMLVHKYPKWISTIQDNKGKYYYFDGVKDMMKFYLNPKKFKHDIKAFSKITVLDYYTLKPIDAKKSYFVIGSNIYGPMGEELIAFQNIDDAKRFKKEHFGKQIVNFNQITDKLLYH